MKPYFETELGTLYSGDCLEVLSEIDLSAVTVVLTDPPYGGGLSVDYAERFKTKAGKWWKNTDRSIQKRHDPIEGDDTPFDPIPLLKINCSEKILWGGNWYSNRLPDSGGWFVWDKRNGTRDVSKADWPMSEAELAWTNIGKGVRVFRHTWFGLIRDSERGEHYHPTQKPVALMAWCLGRSKTDGVVLDPYCGSGPIPVACERLGRRWIGIEISKDYCDIAVSRIKRETAQLKLRV